MPKHGALTPKAIANRIKAKGLQKLRWYCQMCAKQCRDENGFKCHTTSESHLRQMRIFSENPQSVIGDFSREFEKDFIDVLSRRFGTKRTHANQVYHEVIAHKTHVHMNATRWESLTGFVKYLGRTGKCVVDETEKGWYIQWINRDPVLLAKQEAAEKRKKADINDEERQRRDLESRARMAHALKGDDDDSLKPTELKRDEGTQPITLAISSKSERKRPRSSTNALFDDAEESGRVIKAPTKKSTMDILMEQEKKRQALRMASEKKVQDTNESVDELPNWLHEGIVVKILNKKVGGGKFFKMKGKVLRVIEDYIGEVQVLEGNNEKIRIDQEDLETVIPSLNREVLVLNGRCRGCVAKLLSVNIDAFSASVEIIDGKHKGEILANIVYENISKLA